MKQLKLVSIAFCTVGVLLALLLSIVRLVSHDTEGPTIQMDSDTIVVRAAATDEELLAGVTATDSRDGDVTDSLMVESLSNFVATNERELNIVAFDSDNNVTTAKRIVTYTDYTPPHFALSKPLAFSTGISNLTNAMNASDVLDGNLSKRIMVYNAGNSTFDKSAPGDYSILFSVVNSAGDVSKFEATVTIKDPSELSNAALELSDYLVYIPRGEVFDAALYLDKITVDGISYIKTEDGQLVSATDFQKTQRGEAPMSEAERFDFDLLTVTDAVNTAVPGWNEVTYSVRGLDGDSAVARLIVCVEG